MLRQEHAVLQYLHMFVKGAVWQLVHMQAPFAKCINLFVC